VFDRLLLLFVAAGMVVYVLQQHHVVDDCVFKSNLAQVGVLADVVVNYVLLEFIIIINIGVVSFHSGEDGVSVLSRNKGCGPLLDHVKHSDVFSLLVDEAARSGVPALELGSNPA